MFGLGNIYESASGWLGGSPTTVKKKTPTGSSLVYNSKSNDGGYDSLYGTFTGQDGKTTDVTKSDYDKMIAEKKDYGKFSIATPSGSDGFGFSDFATGAKMFGDIAGGAAGLGTVILADRNDKRQEERDEYLKYKDLMAENKIAQIQANYDQTR